MAMVQQASRRSAMGDFQDVGNVSSTVSGSETENGDRVGSELQ